MFVVKSVVTLANGKKLYLVKDVNHKSRSYGKIGYITANSKYVTSAYYQKKHSTMTVINPSGINGYKTKGLTGKKTHYKQGTVLHVKSIVKHNLTTRYILDNGQYITANRKLVEMGIQKIAAKIKTKHSIKLYKNVNLTKKASSRKVFKKGTTLKVIRFEYSKANDLGTYGAKRYLVKGGYITGNRNLVKVNKLK